MTEKPTNVTASQTACHCEAGVLPNEAISLYSPEVRDCFVAVLQAGGAPPLAERNDS